MIRKKAALRAEKADPARALIRPAAAQVTRAALAEAPVLPEVEAVPAEAPVLLAVEVPAAVEETAEAIPEIPQAALTVRIPLPVTKAGTEIRQIMWTANREQVTEMATAR